MPASLWRVLIPGVVGVSLALMVARALALARLPIHLRWELAPMPHDRAKEGQGGSLLEQPEWWRTPLRRSRGAVLVHVAREMLLFRQVWIHNRSLWPLTYSLHLGLYLTAATSLLLMAVALLSPAGLRVQPDSLFATCLSALTLIGYLLGCAGAIGLLLKRLLDPALRAISTVSRGGNLLLLLAIFLSGLGAWFRSENYGAELSRLVSAWLGGGPAAVVGVALSIHLATSLAFILYLPLSNMLHFVAKYFTYHSVLWDNRPFDASMERKLKAQMRQPVRWTAPHIGTVGRTCWGEVVRAGAEDEAAP